jgi:hypothetical protein
MTHLPDPLTVQWTDGATTRTAVLTVESATPGGRVVVRSRVDGEPDAVTSFQRREERNFQSRWVRWCYVDGTGHAGPVEAAWLERVTAPARTRKAG